jgi:hypothetical protein
MHAADVPFAAKVGKRRNRWLVVPVRRASSHGYTRIGAMQIAWVPEL